MRFFRVSAMTGFLLGCGLWVWGYGSSPDETAVEAAKPFENPKSGQTAGAVTLDSIPGDNYEERVQQEHFRLKRHILKNKAQGLREEAKIAGRNTGLGILATGVSAAGLTVGELVTAGLYPIAGYVGAGLSVIATMYNIVDTILHWKELTPAQIARNFIMAGLGAGMALWGFFHPASFGIGFLVGLGIAGLFSVIFSAVQWGKRNAEAGEAEREADSPAVHDE